MTNPEKFNQALDLANEGDSSYYAEVGKAYLDGEVVEKNFGKALEWFSKGQKNDIPSCQFELGVMNIKGLGVEKNFLKAKQLLLQSASNEYIDAKYMLSILYFGEINVYSGEGYSTRYKYKYNYFFFNPENPKNKEDAIAWLVSASNSGHAEATAKLGVLYAEGRELPEDFKRAHSLLNKAAKLGSENALISLSMIYRQGAIGQQIDKQKAFSLMKKAASKENHLAQYYLGGFYLEVKDIKNAKESFERSANNGGLVANVQLGTMYVRGDFGEKDYDLAEENLLNAAEKGHSRAQLMLAELYQMESTKKDEDLAMKWCRSAAESGDVDAILKLGIYYWKGIGCESDLDKSIELHKIAHRKGHPAASKKLEILEVYSKEVNKYMFMKNGKFNLKEIFK